MGNYTHRMGTFRYQQTFFTPRGITTTALICVLLGWGLLHYRQFKDAYFQEQAIAIKKQLYLGSDVCSNKWIKADLEGETRCDENRLYLRTPPWERAVFQIISSYSICSGMACSHLLGNMTYILAMIAFVICYLFLVHTVWFFRKWKELRETLPTLFTH